MTAQVVDFYEYVNQKKRENDIKMLREYLGPDLEYVIDEINQDGLELMIDTVKGLIEERGDNRKNLTDLR